MLPSCTAAKQVHFHAQQPYIRKYTKQDNMCQNVSPDVEIDLASLDCLEEHPYHYLTWGKLPWPRKRTKIRPTTTCTWNRVLCLCDGWWVYWSNESITTILQQGLHRRALQEIDHQNRQRNAEAMKTHKNFLVGHATGSASRKALWRVLHTVFIKE